MNDAVGSGPLTAFKNCDEFVRRMREVASAEIDRTGYGLQNLTSNQARTSDERVRIAGPTAPDPAADGSTTSGFDTPSATKTNGRLVLTKSFSKLLVSDFSGSAPVKLSQVTDVGADGSILLAGDRALVLAPGPGGDHTTLSLVDLHDPTHPVVVQKEVIAAAYLAAAETGGVFRVAVSSTAALTAYANGKLSYSAEQLKGQAAELATPQWLPHRQVTDAAGKTVVDGPLLDCTQVRRPPEDAGAELLTVLTIDPTRPDALFAAAPVGVLAGGDLVAFSPTRMVVGTTGGWGASQNEHVGGGAASTPAPLPRDPHTRLHAFDVAGGATKYLGSGEIPNFVDGPGAISPRDGVLRVVTTTVPPWWFDRTDGSTSATRGVTVLGERSGRLVTLGSTTIATVPQKLGVIRWFDDFVAVAPRSPQQRGNPLSVAYDANKGSGPLRLVDLSDPTSPRERGNLDLADGESQLVALGGGRLVAIGTRPVGPAVQDQSEVVTFDLSGPGAPKRLDSIGLGTGSLFDDRAVFWPSRHLIVALGNLTVGSSCGAGQRCVAPTPAVCDQAGGCVDSNPPDGTRQAAGAVGITVDENGKLAVVGWATGHGGFSQLLRVGDHFAVCSLVGVSMLDQNFHVLGTVPIRQASQP
jgi:hypothetical protein